MKTKSPFSYIFEDIIGLANDRGIRFSILDEANASTLRSRISKAYPKVSLSRGIEFYDGEGMQTDESYKFLPSFVADNEVYFLVPERQDQRGIKFKQGSDVAKVLEELNYYLEFVLFDENLKYLIGENHSGVLMALGEAETWLKDLKTS